MNIIVERSERIFLHIKNEWVGKYTCVNFMCSQKLLCTLLINCCDYSDSDADTK